MTSQKLHAGLPQWTVVVTRPEKSRMMVRTNLEVRMAFLALGVLLLTSAAGWLACWPLSNALRKLRGDIDEDYGDDRNTIEQGPEELREVQAAYRELRKRLHARQVSLEEKNVHLASTVVRRESELDAQERLFRESFRQEVRRQAREIRGSGVCPQRQVSTQVPPTICAREAPSCDDRRSSGVQASFPSSEARGNIESPPLRARE